MKQIQTKRVKHKTVASDYQAGMAVKRLVGVGWGAIDLLFRSLFHALVTKRKKNRIRNKRTVDLHPTLSQYFTETI